PSVLPSLVLNCGNSTFLSASAKLMHSQPGSVHFACVFPPPSMLCEWSACLHLHTRTQQVLQEIFQTVFPVFLISSCALSAMYSYVSPKLYRVPVTNINPEGCSSGPMSL